ncbi:uncharacterized protein [Nicotiana sylvestris]|uniref:uncharacterized protein n=1 Tax=Nicotiana sylvestris TaxID=4096 RepID=UPI00388CC288
MAVDMNIKELLVIGDFDLLIHQVQGERSTKNVKILPYLHCVKELSRNSQRLSSTCPHDSERVCRRPCMLIIYNSASRQELHRPIEIEIKDQHDCCFHVNEKPDGRPWYHDIKKILQPRNTQKMLQMVNLGLLRCVDAVEATILLEEIHAETCGPHMNKFTLAKKILRAGYFWMTMESDSIRYVQKCHKC